MSAVVLPAGPFVEWVRERVARGGWERVAHDCHRTPEGLRLRCRHWQSAGSVEALTALDVLHLLDGDPADVWEPATLAPVLAALDGPPAAARRRGGGKPVGVHGRMTDDEIRAAHRLYVARGLSLRALGALVWERFAFASPRSAATSLQQQFVRLGLERRQRLAASVVASTTHGLAPRDPARRSRPEYLRLRREQRRERGEAVDRPRCAGVRVRDGAPCANLAQLERPWCVAHDPDRTAAGAAHLARARAAVGVAS